MRRPTPARPGLATLLLILLLPGLFLFVILVLSIDRDRLATAELRNAATSAGLAAADTLAADDLLTGDHTRLTALMLNARSRAKTLAGKNLAGGKPASLPDADVVFGFTNQSFRGAFDRLAPDDPHRDWSKLNSVEVTTRLASDAGKAATARAVFDTAVTGFRPTPNRPVPLAPFALLDARKPPAGWTAAVAAGRAAAPRELATVTVVFGLPSEPLDLVPAVLGIGARTPTDTLAQVAGGITAAHLADPAAFGGTFSLDPARMTKAVPGAVGALNGNLDAVAAAFSPLVQRAWVWPLFAAARTDVTGSPTVMVNGFVAARLTAVTTVKVTDPMTGVSRTTAVRLTLREAVLATPTAVTRPAPAADGPPPPAQRSVGKVRLAG